MNKQMTETLKQGDNTPVVLISSNGEVEITSVELTQLINQFRLEEGNTSKKEHKHLMRDIRNEIETLEQVGISQSNFGPVTYTDKKVKKDLATNLIKQESCKCLIKSWRLLGTKQFAT